MTADIYLFGELGGGYTQYPDDYTKSIFRDFAKQTKSRTQMLIHRNDNAVYYAYIRRLTFMGKFSDKYIGLCYVISGKLIKDYQGLFKIFEEAIPAITVRGKILEFTSKGEISSKVTHLYDCKAEKEYLSNYLQAQLNGLDHSLIVSLPPLNYSVNSNEKRVCSIDDDKAISSSIGIYSYVIINKESDIDTDSLRTYSNVLKNNLKRIDELEKSNTQLQNECSRLKRVEKRFKTVMLLSAIIIAITIVLINVVKTSNERAGKIDDQNMTIGGLRQDVDELNEKNTNILSSLERTSIQLEQANELIVLKNDTIADLSLMCTDLKASLVRVDKQMNDQISVNKKQSEQIQNYNVEIQTLRKIVAEASSIRIDPQKVDIQMYLGQRKAYGYSPSNPWVITGIDRKWSEYQIKIYYDGNLIKIQPIKIKR